jgi:hypothetical protein
LGPSKPVRNQKKYGFARPEGRSTDEPSRLLTGCRTRHVARDGNANQSRLNFVPRTDTYRQIGFLAYRMHRHPVDSDRICPTS